jgi:hypothetical protein
VPAGQSTWLLQDSPLEKVWQTPSSQTLFVSAQSATEPQFFRQVVVLPAVVMAVAPAPQAQVPPGHVALVVQPEQAELVHLVAHWALVVQACSLVQVQLTDWPQLLVTVPHLPLQAVALFGVQHAPPFWTWPDAQQILSLLAVAFVPDGGVQFPEQHCVFLVQTLPVALQSTAAASDGRTPETTAPSVTAPNVRSTCRRDWPAARVRATRSIQVPIPLPHSGGIHADAPPARQRQCRKSKTGKARGTALLQKRHHVAATQL